MVMISIIVIHAGYALMTSVPRLGILEKLERIPVGHIGASQLTRTVLRLILSVGQKWHRCKIIL